MNTPIDRDRVRVIAFDVFGTVVDFSGVDRSEVKDYVTLTRQPTWRPLALPGSWSRLPAHPDSAAAVARLREAFTVVTCSNGPLRTLVPLSKHNGIAWDAIVPLELARVYKPDLEAYKLLCNLFYVATDQVLMVTANREFGDLEAARKLNMQAALVRDPAGDFADLAALADYLLGE
jgi:2-haloalkanoic acid dehalogenase type II